VEDQQTNHEPGNVITPGSPTTTTPDNSGAPEPDRPTEQPEPTAAPAPEPEPEPAVTTPNVGQFQTHQEAGVEQPVSDIDTVTWSASEFIEHEKSPAWYGSFLLGSAVLAVLVFFLTKHDIVSTSAVVLVAVLFGAAAVRKPQVRQYAVSDAGVQLGNKSYAYQSFKSFSVAEEGAVVSVVLMPLKRFMPSLTLYLPPDMEDKVVHVLSAVLPMEAHRQDAVDRFLKRIRF